MEKELKPEESIQIINEMISSAKRKLSESSFYFLFWGWMISMLSLAHFVIEYFKIHPKAYMVWTLIIPGILVTAVYGYVKGRTRKTFTHIDRIQIFTWLGFMVSYFIVLIFMKEFNYKISSLIFILVALPTLVTGAVLKFKPLYFGAVVFWIGAVLSFIIPANFIQLLGFVIVALGYLVPGYMLKFDKKKDA